MSGKINILVKTKLIRILSRVFHLLISMWPFLRDFFIVIDWLEHFHS
jgi:hypothetical protein